MSTKSKNEPTTLLSSGTFPGPFGNASAEMDPGLSRSSCWQIPHLSLLLLVGEQLCHIPGLTKMRSSVDEQRETDGLRLPIGCFEGWPKHCIGTSLAPQNRGGALDSVIGWVGGSSVRDGNSGRRPSCSLSIWPAVCAHGSSLTDLSLVCSVLHL